MPNVYVLEFFSFKSGDWNLFECFEDFLYLQNKVFFLPVDLYCVNCVPGYLIPSYGFNILSGSPEKSLAKCSFSSIAGPNHMASINVSTCLLSRWVNFSFSKNIPKLINKYHMGFNNCYKNLVTETALACVSSQVWYVYPKYARYSSVFGVSKRVVSVQRPRNPGKLIHLFSHNGTVL